MNQNEFWMRRALELARKGAGRTRPNPLVGAVVVRKGKIVGEGYHAYFGGPHAEVRALRRAGRRSQGAALYVTLEPCSTWGKTPPCVDRVVASGVSRVVIGTVDPNPLNHLQGIHRLRKSGITVDVGILANEVERQNQPFFKAMRTGLPYVILKMAQSLDGKIAARTGESRWISSQPARRFVHQLRGQADAILVGKNTALQDDPALLGGEGGTKPWRVVLDSHLQVSRASRIFKGSQLTLVAISERDLNRLPENSKQRGIIFLPVPEKKGRLELRVLFRKLAEMGVQTLLVEGGGEVAWSLLQERLVDRLIWIVAPKILGGRGTKTSVEGEGIDQLTKAFSLEWEKYYPLGPDFVFEARVCSRAS